MALLDFYCSLKKNQKTTFLFASRPRYPLGVLPLVPGSYRSSSFSPVLAENTFSVLTVEKWRTHAERCLMGPARWTACGGLTWLGCMQDKISNFALPFKINLALNYTFDLLFSFRVKSSSVSTWSLIYSCFDNSYNLELWKKSFLSFQPPGF